MNDLPESEKVIWRRLSVFEGSFSLESARAVCAGEGIEKDDVSYVLTCAANEALLVIEEQGGGTRYQLPESLHQELRLHLSVSEGVGTLRDQHASFYLKLALGIAHQPSRAGARSCKHAGVLYRPAK